MKAIIDLILKQHLYIAEEKVQLDSIGFYKHSDKNIASYFLINNIDCREFEQNEKLMKLALEKLERDYSILDDSQNETIKMIIQKSFDNNQEASQIDKNTSAIYLIQFSDMKNLNLHRNLIYAIEESPNYFKRYIIPYTETQLTVLQSTIDNYEGRDIADILSDIANNEDEYYKLLEGKNIGSVYELVIRLFSKVPFLQYKFKADPTPLSIENDISQKITDGTEKYHNLIKHGNCTLEQLLEIENDLEMDDQKLEKELNRLLGGVK